MTANQAWQNAIADLLCRGRDSSPRGQPTKELLSYSSQVDMRFPIVTVPERKLSPQFMAAEARWILNGDDKVGTIAPYAPSIANFSDDGQRFFGAYGPRVIHQLSYVVRALESDQDTRQAVMTIWRQNPPKTKDVPCTVSIQWLIRGGALHCVDTMRSSDVWLGWPYDVFNFTMLTVAILLLLRDRNGCDLQLGSLWLNAGSQHLYGRNHEKALTCVAASFLEPVALDWTEFWGTNHLMGYLKRVSNYKPFYYHDPKWMGFYKHG